MNSGGRLAASPAVGPKSPRCSVALAPPYQCASSPIVMWASASMCAPECIVALTTSVMHPRCTRFGAGAHRFSPPTCNPCGVR